MASQSCRNEARLLRFMLCALTKIPLQAKLFASCIQGDKRLEATDFAVSRLAIPSSGISMMVQPNALE